MHINNNKEILAVGSIAFDSLQTPKGNRKRILGGSCTYFSIAASYFTKVSILGIVGDDFSKKEWDLFDKHNINKENIEVKAGNTFSWGGKYNHDYSRRETLFTKLGVFENFSPNIKQKFDNPILYLGNIQPELQFDVINKIKEPFLIAADSMNLWIDMYPNDILELISKVDIFMLNDEEACQLTKKNNLENIADKLLNKGPKIIIIKMGSKGAMVAYKNKKTYVSVVPNTPLYDPTGAGDSFAGGFLGYVATHGLRSPEQAVIHGNAIASYTVSGFGTENLCKIKQDDLQNKIKS